MRIDPEKFLALPTADGTHVVCKGCNNEAEVLSRCECGSPFCLNEDHELVPVGVRCSSCKVES